MEILKRRRHFSSFTMVRSKFGFTQQQFADVLGVSRSLIAMAEAGNRSLPAHARNRYHELIGKANEIPFSDSMRIKRGRKPLHLRTGTAYPVAVTNYGTGRRSGRRRWSRAKIQAVSQIVGTPDFGERVKNTCCQLKTSAECEAFLERMVEYKNNSGYWLTGAKMQLEATERIGKEMAARLTVVSVLLDAGNSLMARLPECGIRDKQEIENAKNHYLQLKLKHQFKKYSPMAILQIQFRINCLERDIKYAEECIGLIAGRKALLEYFREGIEKTYKL